MSEHIETISQTFNVRNENITVESDAMVDDNTGKLISNIQLDDKAIQKAFDVYRDQHDILFPKQIVELRSKYGLSQRAFSKLLGIGAATIARYERGVLPTESINALLSQMREETSLESFFKNNKSRLNVSDQEHIVEVLSKSQQSELQGSLEQIYLERNGDNSANLFDGFKSFDYETFKNMVVYFIQQSDELTETRLNKLMFYSDVSYFKTNAVSISGATYFMNSLGPEMKDLQLLLLSLHDNKSIDENISAKSGEVFYTTSNIFDSRLFYQDQISTMEIQIERFKELSIHEICDYSRNEFQYLDQSSEKQISYKALIE